MVFFFLGLRCTRAQTVKARLPLLIVGRLVYYSVTRNKVHLSLSLGTLGLDILYIP